MILELGAGMTGKPRILIIDDDMTLRESIADLFRISDYEVVEASSGEQGLQRLEQGRPDIIISDVMLPGIDGIELRKRLLQSPEGSIPFIFISAKADVHSLLRQNELDRETVVSKPFDSLELLRIV